MLRRSFLMAAMILVPAGLAAAPAGSAAASVPGSHASASCARVIKITRLVFRPPAVAPGAKSTAKLAARNCTGSHQKTTAVWLGKFVGSGTGIPPGCPAIDPLPQAARFAPHGTFHSHVGYLVPAACIASELQVTVKIEKGGTVLAARTADLTIRRSAAGAGEKASAPRRDR